MIFRRIRDLREDHDLSQKQIGDLLGISQRAYSYYETGTSQLTAEILIRLADFYGVTVDYLLGRSDVPNWDEGKGPERCGEN